MSFVGCTSLRSVAKGEMRGSLAALGMTQLVRVVAERGGGGSRSLRDDNQVKQRQKQGQRQKQIPTG